MTQAAKVILFGALIHAVLFALAAVLVYLTIGQGALGEAARESVNAPRILAQHRGAAVSWLVWTAIAGWLMSSAWVALVADRRQVHQRQGAGQHVGGWVVFLGITVLVAALLLFFRVDASYFHEIAIGTQLMAEGIVFVVLILAFWLATAMLVKPAMQGAVPGGGVLPSIGA